MRHDFQPLTITAVRRETADANSYTLDVPPQLREDFKWRAGQHLVVRAMLQGEEVRRTYSISCAPHEQHPTITIKRVDGGQFSTWAHEHLKPGATIEAMAPAGRFVAPSDERDGRTYLAIAAGSGITPVIAIIRHVLDREPNSRFALIYGNRSADQIIFREALDDLKDLHLQRLTVLNVMSRDSEDDVPLLSGRIDGDKIKRLLPSLAATSDIDHVYLCGPGSMIVDARNALAELGVPRERMHFEFFKAGPEPEGKRAAPRTTTPDPAVAAGTEVIAVLDGARHTFRAPPGTLVVDAALAAGVRVPYSCKGGMCCTCRAKLVEGEVEMVRNFSLEPWEMQAGFVLTCQSLPKTARIVVDYDQM